MCEVDNGVKFNPFYVREMRRPSANSRNTVRKTSSHRIDMQEEGECISKSNCRKTSRFQLEEAEELLGLILMLCFC